MSSLGDALSAEPPGDIFTVGHAKSAPGTREEVGFACSGDEDRESRCSGTGCRVPHEITVDKCSMRAQSRRGALPVQV
ncbi:MAG TPA: hypothetical protein VNF75_01345 [Candidatus Dormibacteraeota bacterium]|nr:hypothetical protein [Candidatus Dormibacteraeota bacterium]